MYQEDKPEKEIGWDGHAKTAGSAIVSQFKQDEVELQKRRDQYNKGNTLVLRSV